MVSIDSEIQHRPQLDQQPIGFPALRPKEFYGLDGFF